MPESPKIKNIERLSNFKSEFVSDRHIDIYLPPGYQKSQKKFPVIYFNEGQKAFDPIVNQNSATMELDSIVDKMINDSEINPFIIVAIWSEPNSWNELMPEDIFTYLDQKHMKSEYRDVKSNNYLNFITEELKPYIDSHYKTLTDIPNTCMMGIGTGALFSWYAQFKRPDIFGKSICIATHWPAVEIKHKHPVAVAVKEYFKNNIPEPNVHQLYFDYGTEGIEQYYQAHQYEIDSYLEAHNWVPRKHYVTSVFTDQKPNIQSWRERLHFCFLFLFKNQGAVM